MNWRPSEELERLLNGLADGVQSDEEEARLAEILRGDEAARRRYRQFMALHAGLMWDYAAAATSAGAAPVHRWRGAWALAAMLAVIGILAILWLQKPRTHDIAQLEAATGAVSWSDDSGAQRAGLAAGARLAEGTLLLEGETGSAQLRFADGSLLTLTGETELGFSDAGQKQLNLRRGSLSAQVRPQAAGRPMKIRTPTAEIHVVGTVFNLSARPDDTLLKVDEGSVTMKRLSDARVINVPAQSSALASLSDSKQLAAAATPEPLHEWRFDFANSIPPERWRGVWQSSAEGGRMVASPYVAKRRPDGTTTTHFGVSIRTAYLSPPLALVARADSAIRYRLRQERRAPLQVMLLTSSARGGYGGNFECKVPAERLHADAAGWCDLEIPMSEFAPADPRKAIREKYPSPAGNILTSVLLSSFQQDTKLTVSSFDLLSPPSR